MPAACGVSRVAVMGGAETQHRRAAERRGREACHTGPGHTGRGPWGPSDVTPGGGAVLTCHTGPWARADVSHRRRVRADVTRCCTHFAVREKASNTWGATRMRKPRPAEG